MLEPSGRLSKHVYNIYLISSVYEILTVGSYGC